MIIPRAVKDIPLHDLRVLYLDCQTTGATPVQGDVLEIGWADSEAGDEVESYVLSFPEDYSVPKRVLSITGISPEEVEGGHTETYVWKALLRASRTVSKAHGIRVCPTIIHYARFEEPFLNDLHEKHSTRKSFPFMTTCTHAISKRLYPDLPRKGIRAVAGFLGYSVGESRRSADHVRATAYIWRRIIEDLEVYYGISTLSQLLRWMEDEPVRSSAGRTYPMEAEVRCDLPDRPGVYRMLRAGGEVLYVGKATSLKQRVNSYFRRSTRHPEHILEMLSQARKLEVTETGTALEAALLETDEIKRLAPPYNKALRTRERRILFCTPEFDVTAMKPDAYCRIGPFSSEGTIRTLGAIRKVMRADHLDDLEDDVLGDALGISPEYRPDVDCLRTGMEAARMALCGQLDVEKYSHALIALGRDMWQKRLEDKALEEEAEIEDIEEYEEKEEVEFVWTPEAVVRTVGRNVMWAAREMRRARWFTILTESSIAWNPGGRSDAGRRCIVVDKGRIGAREWMDADADLPVPPGYGKSKAARQEAFDIETWDRMRVLTTEIKRLTGNGCHPRIRLGRRHGMGNTQLEKLFMWI